MIKRSDINIRDPFVLAEGGFYYMYGSTDKNIWGGECRSFDVYKSRDLENFEPPVSAFTRFDGFWANENYWAPEVHRYRGKYYMLASFRAKGRRRGSQILVADRPEGPFTPLADGPFTPSDWDCLDATLYVENGRPYAVYCHEWTQIQDGEICYQELSPDLKGTVSPPVKMFAASSAPWTRAVSCHAGDFNGRITDAPFFYRLKSGSLLMLWSSAGAEGYAVGLSVSENGGVTGRFAHYETPLFAKDGGHAMVFRALDGRLLLALHRPNAPPGAERPAFFEIAETGDGLLIKSEI
ncbi:MAG: glycoside hydrolase family 43 protein [Clostridiales bacterium]|jgi:hypothetical protein|nr:glycoside hydrolase family 43 protein [Clostridiales bacterium]